EHRADHRRDLGIVARGQRVLADHVDVALVELAEAAALGALATVHALHLVAAERERQFVFVLGHVARQRHGQVEAQRELRQPLGCLLQRAGGLGEIDLALGFAAGLGQQDLRELEHRRLDRQEAEALEDPPDRVEHALERDLVAGQQFQDAGRGSGLDHACRGSLGKTSILPAGAAAPAYALPGRSAGLDIFPEGRIPADRYHGESPEARTPCPASPSTAAATRAAPSFPSIVPAVPYATSRSARRCHRPKSIRWNASRTRCRCRPTPNSPAAASPAATCTASPAACCGWCAPCPTRAGRWSASPYLGTSSACPPRPCTGTASRRWCPAASACSRSTRCASCANVSRPSSTPCSIAPAANSTMPTIRCCCWRAWRRWSAWPASCCACAGRCGSAKTSRRCRCRWVAATSPIISG